MTLGNAEKNTLVGVQDALKISDYNDKKTTYIAKLFINSLT